MKVESFEIDHGENLMTINTTTERSFLGVKLSPIKRTFIANIEYPKGYWNWVEIPNKTLVDYRISFQLNEWLKSDN